ncbi:hypothetical protein TIFTF001_021005 [Ficus carica]|uniref:Uncharacterized protein n=1 Tax=Ficus carica TaxID=3494 RepID=A0AA88DAC1_FICCA|nr:hypothetical protein TIFTF001_021005 [Ficus carica]
MSPRGADYTTVPRDRRVMSHPREGLHDGPPGPSCNPPSRGGLHDGPKEPSCKVDFTRRFQGTVV